MWSYFTWIIDSISSLWFSPIPTIIFLGLDDTGKTTLVNHLVNNQLIQTLPTIRGSKHKVKIDSTIVTIIDTCDYRQIQLLIDFDTFNSIRLVFMIDVSNCDRLLEARDKLLNLLEDVRIESIPILILANKIDKINIPYNENQLINLFKIDKYLNKENSHIKLCMCSLKYRIGFTDGLRWLIKKKQE